MSQFARQHFLPILLLVFAVLPTPRTACFAEETNAFRLQENDRVALVARRSSNVIGIMVTSKRCSVSITRE
ncbi:MAG: hypothetical protein R3C11_02395 [Planctomycetaceae bacterium]